MPLSVVQPNHLDRVERLAREKRLVRLHKVVAAEMTLAQAAEDQKLADLLERSLWALTAAIEWGMRA